MRGGRRGFTLIEVVAGLALAGMVFTSILLLVDQLRDGRDRLIENGRRTNKAANGAEMLRLLVARAEARGDSLERFIGSDQGAAFRSWCEVPGGWLERCSVRLSFETTGDSTFLNADLSTGEHLTLMAGIQPLRLIYFDATTADAQWVAEWGRSSAVPSAVGVVARQDTITMRAGGRG